MFVGLNVPLATALGISNVVNDGIVHLIFQI